MLQRRRFHRVQLAAKSSLVLGERRHEGRLENVSLNGALISFPERVPVAPGDRCLLLIYHNGDAAPRPVAVDVVHVSFTMVGTQFVEVEEETRNRLCRIVAEANGDPKLLEAEMEHLKHHVAGYFRNG